MGAIDMSGLCRPVERVFTRGSAHCRDALYFMPPRIFSDSISHFPKFTENQSPSRSQDALMIFELCAARLSIRLSWRLIAA